MSGATDWNAKDVKAFKQAFGARNDFRWPIISEPAYDPAAGFDRAASMLRKRQDDAQRTLAAVNVKHTPLGHGLLPGLRTMETELAARTTAELTRHPSDRAEATERLIGLTDEWIAFEARCISANNEMTAGKSDAGVRQKLMERANGLAATLAGFKASPPPPEFGPPPDFRSLEGSVLALVAQASNGGRGIADMAAFAKSIDTYTKQVREVGQRVIASFKLDELDPTVVGYSPSYTSFTATVEGLRKLQLKQLYNIEVKSEPFPFDDLLEVLTMVPADHSLTKALTTVSRDYETLFDGADYDAEKKTIRINPLFEWADWLEGLLPERVTADYTDPETGKEIRLSRWKVTALHEIGHAVDEAYGIMKAHQGKPGCGTWVEREPKEFLPEQYATFLEAMRNSRIPDETFLNKMRDGSLAAIFGAAALGDKTPDSLRPEIHSFWSSIDDGIEYKPFQDRKISVNLMVGKLTAELGKIFGSDRTGDVAAARSTLLADSALTAITDTEPVITKEAFTARFDALAVGPTTVDEVKGWLSERRRAYGERIEADWTAYQTANRTARLERLGRWTGATVAALPRPVDLKAYREDASPWKRDISGEPIKAHQAYKANKKWWQYSGDDRRSTFVSTYQWRAPGEWFAELYAVTWFKQVEPPAGVAREVRPYLFGGHITPDAAT